MMPSMSLPAVFQPPNGSILCPKPLSTRITNCLLHKLRKTLVFGLLTLCVGLTASGDVLRVGLAKVDITPSLPVTLSGYESRKGLSQGVHDPLSARVVAFEKDGEKMVLISTDLIGFYGTADLMRAPILARCKLAPSELLLSCIHTHSAPAVAFDPTKGHSNNVAYSNELVEKLVAVVQQALESLQPVELGFGVGSSPVGANRRQVVQDGPDKTKIILGRNPNVLTDREVEVIELRSAGQTNPLAALFSYDCHSTSLGPRNYIISGDVHGLAEQFLEKYLGAPVIAAGFGGTSGNVDPWYRVQPEFKTTRGWVPEPVLLGTLLGEEVSHVLDDIRKFDASGPIRTVLSTIRLPAKAKVSSTAPDQAAVENTTVPLNLTVGRVGQIAFVGFGCEVFNEIGKTIKTRSPFPLTFLTTQCNGAAGYLPTTESYAAGGYEVESSPFAPGSAERVVQEALRLLAELKAED